jgi:hypothetical protein
MSDDPVTRILSAVERLRAEVLARIDRLESVSRGNPDLLPARVAAHVQNVGDLEGNLGDWLGERRLGRWVEGFRIGSPQNVTPAELRYRVVLGPGQLSPWTLSGRFCGREGLAQPLRGFCVTLQGAAAGNYECSYTATFVDGSVASLIPSSHRFSAPRVSIGTRSWQSTGSRRLVPCSQRITSIPQKRTAHSAGASGNLAPVLDEQAQLGDGACGVAHGRWMALLRQIREDRDQGTGRYLLRPRGSYSKNPVCICQVSTPSGAVRVKRRKALYKGPGQC